MERRNCTSTWTERFLEDSFFLTLEAAEAISADCSLNAAQSAILRRHLELLRITLGRQWLVLLLQHRLDEDPSGENGDRTEAMRDDTMISAGEASDQIAAAIASRISMRHRRPSKIDPCVLIGFLDFAPSGSLGCFEPPHILVNLANPFIKRALDTRYWKNLDWALASVMAAWDVAHLPEKDGFLFFPWESTDVLERIAKTLTAEPSLTGVLTWRVVREMKKEGRR
jgi:hypothetical protein